MCGILSIARRVSGVSLRGGPERPSCEAVKVEPGLPWRTQDVGNARVAGDLPRKAANWEWNSSRGRSVLQSTKLEGAGDLKSAGHQT